MLDDKLTPRVAAGYGVGDFAMNLYWGAISFFLLYWYTDVVGLPANVAGFLFFVGAVWDAVSDPTVGLLVERNRSRWGRYRPFLLLGTIPLAASFALLFWVPPLEGAALIAALLGAHVLFRTAYTLVGIPYSALSARLSSRSEDRTTLASARMIAATTGALLISAAGFPLVHSLGDGDERAGFFYLAILAGAVAVSVHLLCFATTREPQELAADAKSTTRCYSVHELIAMTRANTAFLFLLAMIPFFSAAAVLMQKNLVYYVKYGLQAHDQQHVVLFAHGLMTVLATPLWAYVANRWGRRQAWICSTVLMLLSGQLMFLVTTDSLRTFVLLLLPMSMSFAAMGVLFWSMLPDTIEYGQWRSGYRGEAVFFGMATFTQKLAIGFAGWMLGVALAAVGFVPAAQQSAETITTIKLGMTLAPAALMLLSLTIVLRYPLNEKLHRQIRQELVNRG